PDPTCLCKSTKFQEQAATCLQDNCTPADIQTALAVQDQQCGAAGASPSGSTTSSSASHTTKSRSFTSSATTIKGTTSTAPIPATSATSISSFTSPSTTSSVTSAAHTSSLAASSAANGPGSGTATPNDAASREGNLGLVGLMIVGFFGIVL
ncbi:hypothetical protein C0991_010856, partial [Blastosporella zonata]